MSTATESPPAHDYPRRRGIVTVVSVGMAVLLFSLVVVSTLGMVGFFRVQHSLRIFSEREIPLIILGSRLSDSTNRLMIEVERLIASGSEAGRRIAYAKVRENFTVLEEQLGTEGISQVGLMNEFRVLQSSVAELDALVSSRIEIGRKTDVFNAALLKYPEAAHLLAAESGAISSGTVMSESLHRWIAGISGILSQCVDAASLTNPSAITSSETGIIRSAAALKLLSADFPVPLRNRTVRFEADLDETLFGTAGLMTVLKERSVILREETAKSNIVRRLADDFRTASANLFNEFVLSAAEETRGISRMVSQTLAVFILVFLVATAAFISVLLYFRKRLILRLVHLNDAILRQVAGSTVAFDTDGNDEITDMACSFRFYVDAVNDREKSLLELATRDSLTGISNRRHFMETARQELVREERYGRPASMLMLDIDFFKPINDTWGHAAGDLVLKSVVSACKASIRDIDIFGRVGGEEFAFLLLETDMPLALEIAERIRAGVEASVCMIDGTPVTCTVSIGAAASPAHGYTCESLLKSADSALYLAKNACRNCVRCG